MASHHVSFALGAHVRFGTLEFLILEGSQLELVGSAPQVPPPADSDMVAETLKGLRLDALEAHALESVPAPVFNYGRLERLHLATTVLGGPPPPLLLLRQRHGADEWERAAPLGEHFR